MLDSMNDTSRGWQYESEVIGGPATRGARILRDLQLFCSTTGDVAVSRQD